MNIDRKKANSNQNDTYRNFETRMKYEYPKGKFRFPIIPDEEQGEQIKQINSKKVPERPQKQHPIIHHKKTEQPVKKTTIEKLAKPEVAYKKIEPINKRPFKPTEIPSPVYGFKRPPKKEEKESDFEFELPGITTTQTFNDVGLEESVTSEKTIDLLREIKLKAPIPKEEEEVLEAKDEGNGRIIEESQNNMFDLNNGSELLSKEENVEISEVNEFNEEKNVEITEVNEFNEEKNVEITEVNEFNEEKNVEITEVNEFNEEANFEIDEVSGVNDEDEQTETDITVETETPSRSHIPFNVLMLKQDRQKWEEKSQKKISSEKELKQETMVNREIFQSFVFPSYQLLLPPVISDVDGEWVKKQSDILNETLLNFNVRAKVVNVSQGPSVTRFEIQPEPGVKVNKITNLSDDLKLSLAAKDIRIEAPIPGKHTVGIEIPNMNSRPVMISEIIFNSVFKESKSPLTAALGLDISGNPIITDLRKMPHGLIAGATGSGKSVCINSILVSLLYKATPNELKLLLIDPKMVELAPYNHIPHLVSPVITDVKAATAALKWAVEEMERRYELFAHTGVRDIQRFNELAEAHRQFNDKLPYIVIVIDELADLMMMSPADVEEAICRIAQKARACGIHLIIATQRPSVDVITGLIKANVPTRIAFSVSSQVDSRTIIDISGAEKLLGRGDMLFLENGSSKPVRLQGTFVTDEEIDRVVHHVRQEEKPNYLFEQEELLKKAQIEDEEDEIFFEACEFIIDQGGASTSLLQRNFRIGYNRAARLIEMMEQQGIISEAKGSKPRDVLISRTDLEALYEATSSY
ncbi:DNA translocase FtsK [Heyndrickxia vini]|uniref:DNA translocase FtsK n=2 Tax=Heyndrickxia vini TaxID=1476025 RepID=A0ABX7E949_9BACI|nr:DNA translocase FtsK [Heyndrickxia vini]